MRRDVYSYEHQQLHILLDMGFFILAFRRQLSNALEESQTVKVTFEGAYSTFLLEVLAYLRRAISKIYVMILMSNLVNNWNGYNFQFATVSFK